MTVTTQNFHLCMTCSFVYLINSIVSVKHQLSVGRHFNTIIAGSYQMHNVKRKKNCNAQSAQRAKHQPPTSQG